MMRRGLLFLLMPLLLLAVSNPSQKPPLPDPIEPAEQPIPFLAPEEVSSAGVTLHNELAEINATLIAPEEVVQIQTALPAYIDALRTMRREIEADRIEQYSVKRLTRSLEQAAVYRDELDHYEKVLEARVELHSKTLDRFKNLGALWSQTLEHAVQEHAPEAIIERIEKSVKRIAAMQQAAKNAYDSMLTADESVVSEKQKIIALMQRLEKTRATLESRLFVKDSEPLFIAMRAYTFDLPAFLNAAYRTLGEIKQTCFVFYNGNLDRLYLHALLTVGVLLLMVYLYRLDRRGVLFLLRDDKVRGSLLFVRSPLAATIILSVLMVGALYPERPVAVSYGNVMLALVALLVIVYRMTDRTLFRYSLLLSVLFALGGLLNQIIGFELDIRLLWFGIAAIMLVTLFTLLRPGGVLQRYRLGKWMGLVVKVGPGVPVLLGVSLVANLFGYYHLGHKLAHATLISLTIFMAFAVVGVVLNGLIVMFVRRRSHQSKHLLEEYARQIENNLKFIASGFLTLYWGYLVLQQFEISTFVQARYSTFMLLSWQIGDVVISVRSLVDFIIVLVVTTFLTRFVRIVLDLELFSRYEMPRGVPTAIQMLIRYLIITVGILLALSVLGIEMSDLSLVAGALGVGIGFGLRNIMANFVSGVLLVFERPVQMGDVVEVGGIFGDVHRIGVRATTIKTYDGSEVIVPNADFITKEVTNWTLSSKLRRVKTAYKVAFGNHPSEVIAIMKRVVEAHPDIKDDPEPKVLFEGYGDYYLEFTVYYWVEERLLDVKSETAIAIYDALIEAGIRMPVPQSEVFYERAPLK